MSGQYPRFIRKRHQLRADGLDDLAAIPSGQVGAADAAGEKRISRHDHIEGGEVEADGPLGMTGSMQNRGRKPVEADLHPVDKARVGGSHFGRRHPHPRGLLVHHFQQGKVVFVQENGRAGQMFQFEGSPT